MIRFKSINIDGNICSWEYLSMEELERIWRSDDIDMDVPANDDPIFDIEVDGERWTFLDGALFEELLTSLGAEVWG